VVVAHGSATPVSRIPTLAAPTERMTTVARGMTRATLVVGPVVLLLLAPEWIALVRPSVLAVLMAGAIGVVVALHLERRSLVRELRAARMRSVDGRDVERQRIQRDLHDSAQQRLVSLQIHLGLLAESSERPTERATIEQLGLELGEALKEIRAVTHDGYPQLLMRHGLATSIRAAVSGSALPVTVEATEGFGRYGDPIERSVYFCCMEALQNVSKHAGRGAIARVRLTEGGGRIVFEVDDTGVGFDPVRVRRGEGLVNLADRVASLGGRLIVDSRPGMGSRIRGEVPVG
jgi:signal transduction histidine kinase